MLFLNFCLFNNLFPSRQVCKWFILELNRGLGPVKLRIRNLSGKKRGRRADTKNIAGGGRYCIFTVTGLSDSPPDLHLHLV